MVVCRFVLEDLVAGWGDDGHWLSLIGVVGVGVVVVGTELGGAPHLDKAWFEMGWDGVG